MATIAQFSTVLLLTLLSSSHTLARDSQFFNKVPAATPTNVVPKTTQPQPQEQQHEQDPKFQPDDENNYGLYGHESGQLPPSSTTPVDTSTLPPSKYLPKNYNPVAYVTVPEDTNYNDADDNKNTYNNGDDNKYYSSVNKYYDATENYDNVNSLQEGDRTAYRSYPATTDSSNYNYNTGGSRFNSQPLSDNKFDFDGADFGINGEPLRDNKFAAGESNGFRPQGMSDTRSLEGGRYHYDVNSERYSSRHPYESLRGVRRDFYVNIPRGNNGYGQTIPGGYQNGQNEFQREENYNMP